MSGTTKRKVTALITRPGPDGPEVLVFDHPVSGYQLPAGTCEDGESFEAAALREGWEETGALGLELVREVGASMLRDEDRHIFHLRATVEMPDEWRVATPDGGGLIWWCSWMPIDESHALVHEHQRDWLDAARPALDRSAAGDPPLRPRPPFPAELHVEGEWEEFWAHPQHNCRWVVSFADGVDPQVCTRARGLCVDASGAVVLIASKNDQWDVPGGGREPGETIEQNIAREVWEEACCRIVDARHVASLRCVRLDGDGGVAAPPEYHALFWARVELEPFEARFETTRRRLVSPAVAAEITPFPDTTRLLLDRAADLDPLLDWKREPR
jgi:8-oxo-dGTP pyrophosphatase MutT (NUDIX family)